MCSRGKCYGISTLKVCVLCCTVTFTTVLDHAPTIFIQKVACTIVFMCWYSVLCFHTNDVYCIHAFCTLMNFVHSRMLIKNY